MDLLTRDSQPSASIVLGRTTYTNISIQWNLFFRKQSNLGLLHRQCSRYCYCFFALDYRSVEQWYCGSCDDPYKSDRSDEKVMFGCSTWVLSMSSYRAWKSIWCFQNVCCKEFTCVTTCIHRGHWKWNISESLNYDVSSSVPQKPFCSALVMQTSQPTSTDPYPSKYNGLEPILKVPWNYFLYLMGLFSSQMTNLMCIWNQSHF